MERPLSNFERLHAEVSGKLAPLQGTPFSSSFAHARSSVALASCDLAICPLLFSCVPVCIVGLRQGHFERSVLDCTNEKRRCSESFRNNFFCVSVN